MRNGGLAKARLDRMHHVMTGHVERGDVPGLVTRAQGFVEAELEHLGLELVMFTV